MNSKQVVLINYIILYLYLGPSQVRLHQWEPPWFLYLEIRCCLQLETSPESAELLLGAHPLLLFPATAAAQTKLSILHQEQSNYDLQIWIQDKAKGYVLT